MCPLTVSHIVVWNDVKHTEQVNSLSPQSHKWNCSCPFQHLTKIKNWNLPKNRYTLGIFVFSSIVLNTFVHGFDLSFKDLSNVSLYWSKNCWTCATWAAMILSIDDYRTRICVLVVVTWSLQNLQLQKFRGTWLHRSVSYLRFFRIKFLYFNLWFCENF